MAIKKLEYARVTRVDGTVQYFQVTNKAKGELCPVGGGFGLTLNNETVKSIEYIDELPNDLVIGWTAFDEFEESTLWRAIVNKHDTWNGWAKPYIFADDIEKFLKDIAVEDFAKSHLDETKVLVIINDVPEYNGGFTERIEPEQLLGITVYNVGDLGWTFSFYETKPELR
jgi:hypothetical protein